ncbi:RanBP1 domain-containing protein [Mycena leptocephala]|nr:RanBP1 domain-containing protein [Mycena leptocephala]
MLELNLDPVSEQEVLFKTHGKLFQFDCDTGQWKKLGTGIVLLLAEETQQVRLVIREDITSRVFVNHIVSADIRLHPNIECNRSWRWKVAMSSECSETFSIRFPDPDDAVQFKIAFEESQETVFLAMHATLFWLDRDTEEWMEQERLRK